VFLYPSHPHGRWDHNRSESFARYAFGQNKLRTHFIFDFLPIWACRAGATGPGIGGCPAAPSRSGGCAGPAGATRRGSASRRARAGPRGAAGDGGRRDGEQKQDWACLFASRFLPNYCERRERTTENCAAKRLSKRFWLLIRISMGLRAHIR
jgi:hypothetical protein